MTNDSIPEVEHLPRAEMTDKTTNYPLEANLERLQAQMQNMEEETRFGFLEHFLKGSAQLKERLGSRRRSADHMQMDRMAGVERAEQKVRLARIVRKVQHERCKTRDTVEGQYTTRWHKTRRRIRSGGDRG